MSRHAVGSGIGKFFITWLLLGSSVLIGQSANQEEEISDAVQPPPGVEVRVIEMPTPVDSDVGTSEDAGIDPQTPVPRDAPVVPFGDTGRNDTGTDDTGTNDTGRNDTGRNDTGTDDTGRNDTGRDGNEADDDEGGSFTIEGDAAPAYDEPDEGSSSGIKLYGNMSPTPNQQKAAREQSMPAPEYQPVRLRLRQQTDSNLFGSYRIRLSGVRPSFSDIPLYKTLYGDERWYPALQADWFAFDWYATLGLTYRIGYYTAKGYAAQENAAKDIGGIGTNSDAGNINSSNIRAGEFTDDVQKDLNGPTELTFLPMQAGLTAEFTPFWKKWLVLDLSLGLERSFLQEVRTGTSGGQASSDDEYLTSSTWKSSIFYNASLNILLNPLDEPAVASLRSAMGLDAIYLSPFYEVVKPLTDTGLQLSRTAIGIGFTFESEH